MLISDGLICYGLVDWLIRYPMTAVVTVVFTSCPTRGGQQRNQFTVTGDFGVGLNSERNLPFAKGTFFYERKFFFFFNMAKMVFTWYL